MEILHKNIKFRQLIITFLLFTSFFVYKTQAAESTLDTLTVKRIVSLRDSLSRIRMISFDNISIDNQYKTAGIIEELLNRAETNIFNLFPQGRFPWSWQGIDKPYEMVETAASLMKILSEGKDPFEGKFAEPGGYVIDHGLIKRGKQHHLFYIRQSAVTNWPENPEFNFGHATSEDLKNWKIEKPILQCPKQGWDQYQVWAPYILEHNKTFYMFYTGVNQNYSQAICLATSKDLYNWSRVNSNPIVPIAPWSLWSKENWSDCRDPMVLKDGNVFYCYYTSARIDKATDKHEYCVGISSSTDLLSWKDEGFVRLENSLNTPPESPFVIKKNGKYYMFYTSYKYGIVYLTSNNPANGWKELPVEKMVLKDKVSASEIYEDNGKWYMSYISHEKFSLHFFEICRLFWAKDGSVSIGKSGEL